MLKKIGSLIAGSLLLGTLTALISSFALAVYEPDYTAHLNAVYRLLSGNFLPLPYSGIIGSYVPSALLMKLLGLTFHEVSAILMWSSQYLILGAFYLLVESEQHRWNTARKFLPLTAYFLASSLLMNMMLCRGYLPQLYSWALYALSYLVFFRFQRQLVGLVLLLAGGVTYPDGLMWMLPIFALHLDIPRAKKILLVLLAIIATGVLVATQVRYSRFEGAANTNWITSGLFPAFFLLCGVFMLHPDPRTKPLKQILFLYVLLTGGLALYNQMAHGAVLYYARKNFYFVGLLTPLILAHWPERRWRQFAMGAAAVLTIAATIEMNGTGPDVALRDLVKHTPSFDGTDERFAVRLKGELPTECGRTVIIPGYRSRRGPQEDAYQELAGRLLGYNAVFHGFPPTGLVHLTAIGEKYANIWELSKVLWHNTALTLEELQILPGVCALVSDRYQVKDSKSAGTFHQTDQDRETFMLYLPASLR